MLYPLIGKATFKGLDLQNTNLLAFNYIFKCLVVLFQQTLWLEKPLLRDLIFNTGLQGQDMKVHHLQTLASYDMYELLILKEKENSTQTW